ncbi:MAG: hypothetical protein J6T10_30300 [Methanobrevibacter sp.]|nr:hypothetical protein [Methanobrevibacter sp.]
MNCCEKNCFIINKNYPTKWAGIDFMSISFVSKIDLAGFSAKFSIGDYTFVNDNLSDEWVINLSSEQTSTLPLGMNSGSLIVYDKLGEGKPFTTTLPILVKNWVDGDVKVDMYKATINVTLDGQKQFVINVESGKEDLGSIDGFNGSKVQTLKNINGVICWIDD